jgi:uncharacterized integral membrane protein (TIGR00698 family)
MDTSITVNNKDSDRLKQAAAGLMLAILIGAVGYSAKVLTKSHLVDPLLVAMVIGIIVRTGIPDSRRFSPGFTLAPAIFIPVGIAFYAAKNLNFIKVAKVETKMLILLIVVIAVYFVVILFLGRLLGQRKQITYLTAIGSAICGASAIAISAPAVEAEPDDVSISLVSVALAAFTALYIVLPFPVILFDVSDKVFGLLSGSVLQFTGFVKAATSEITYLMPEMDPKELVSLSLSVKAARYLGLLAAIPLFASMVRGKVYFPWVLWAFLGAGIIGTGIYAVDRVFYDKTLVPWIVPIYDVSWSMAMAAIGLNADIKKLLSNNGTKALIMAFGGFFAAIAAFFIGLSIM